MSYDKETPEQRQVRIFKEDEETQRKRAEDEHASRFSPQYFKDRQLTRKSAFTKYGDELIAMRDVKQGTKYRKWLYRQLQMLADKVFEDEDAEYRSTGKFYRGIWCNIENTFKTKKEMEFITTIAKEYGAFDY